MLHRHEIRSEALGTTRRVTVWLPPGVRARNKFFPVLYLNDGQNLFEPSRAFAGVTWGVRETVSRLVRRGAIPDYGGRASICRSRTSAIPMRGGRSPARTTSS